MSTYLLMSYDSKGGWLSPPVVPHADFISVVCEGLYILPVDALLRSEFLDVVLEDGAQVRARYTARGLEHPPPNTCFDLPFKRKVINKSDLLS